MKQFPLKEYMDAARLIPLGARYRELKGQFLHLLLPIAGVYGVGAGQSAERLVQASATAASQLSNMLNAFQCILSITEAKTSKGSTSHTIWHRCRHIGSDDQ